jgi:hypothetical protein
MVQEASASVGVTFKIFFAFLISWNLFTHWIHCLHDLIPLPILQSYVRVQGVSQDDFAVLNRNLLVHPPEILLPLAKAQRTQSFCLNEVHSGKSHPASREGKRFLSLGVIPAWFQQESMPPDLSFPQGSGGNPQEGFPVFAGAPAGA